MSIPHLLELTLFVLALLIPSSFGLGALGVKSRAPFRAALAAAYGAGLLAVVVAAGIFGLAASQIDLSDRDQAAAALATWIRLDVVTGLMLLLVSLIAIVIIRYSKAYLHGDKNQARYVRALLLTLALVSIVIVANDLAIIAAAWMGTSLSLHQLLTFYRDRRQAVIAAHKKFILSRLAEACLITALALVWHGAGTLNLDALAALASAGNLPNSLHVAAAFLVLAVCLKSAQIPFHGWLTQVMEAPTPVSALLHAGVVNIGGLVLIRVSPLMVQTPIAQGALVVVGLITAIVASLVMTTRVSVKVALAWSTSAQMGFMLVQCGLGAWDLALLHLIAHSFYKAHAFLSAGSAAEHWRVTAMAVTAPAPEPRKVLVIAATLVAVLGGLVVLAAQLSDGPSGRDPALLGWAMLLAMSLSPVVSRGLVGGWGESMDTFIRAAGVVVLYVFWHFVVGALPITTLHIPASGFIWALVVVAMAVLIATHVLLQARPQGAIARWLQPRLFAGLYLDEFFTRMTFRLWPPRMTPADADGPPPTPAKLREPSL